MPAVDSALRSAMLPLRDSSHFDAFSADGGRQEWTLPPSWEGARISTVAPDRRREMPGPELDVAGRRVVFAAPAGLPVRLTRTAA